MTTIVHRMTFLALMSSLAVCMLAANPSLASQPNALLIAPQPNVDLPKFGFSSFNISGYGERVTHVRWGGLAAQLGLEPGDTILNVNGFRLSYHGSWNDALHRAMASGGSVRLRIRDVRTGLVVSRHMHLGGVIGPITPKIHVVGKYGPNVMHVHRPHQGAGLGRAIVEIAKLIDD
jgi:hypothetical protein